MMTLKVMKQLNKLVDTIAKEIEETAQEIDKQLPSNPETAKKCYKRCWHNFDCNHLFRNQWLSLFKSIGQLVSYAGYDVVEN